jgi:hypothetical protein
MAGPPRAGQENLWRSGQSPKAQKFFAVLFFKKATAY